MTGGHAGRESGTCYRGGTDFPEEPEGAMGTRLAELPSDDSARPSWRGDDEPLDLGADSLDRRCWVAHHELSQEPENVNPELRQRPIPPPVGALSLGVVSAIDLDDELDLRSVEVCDEPPRDRHLALEM